MEDSAIFSRLIDEYGSLEQDGEVKGVDGKKRTETFIDSGRRLDTETDLALMQEEERNTGAVTWETYSKYLRFAGGLYWAPAITLLLILDQGAAGEYLTYFSGF